VLKRGPSAPFANPTLTALQACHVWLPETGTSALLARARPAGGEASVFLPALPSLEHILIDTRGHQHVVLRANGAALQLMIEAPTSPPDLSP
jgi:hypothetical protein